MGWVVTGPRFVGQGCVMGGCEWGGGLLALCRAGVTDVGLELGAAAEPMCDECLRVVEKGDWGEPAGVLVCSCVADSTKRGGRGRLCALRTGEVAL